MLLKVNGKDKQVGEEARLSEAIAGEPYTPGAVIAVTRSTSSIQKETSEFEVVLSKGSFVIRLNDSRFAEVWRQNIGQIVGSSVRWQSTKVMAMGSFPTDLEVDRERYRYSKHDCYFSLGGFDNRTTYVMISKIDHEGSYGTKDGRFGRVTRGRHLIKEIDEGEVIKDIRPVVLELSEKDAIATTDLDLKLEEGMAVDTYVHVDLDPLSPVSCEQLLVISGEQRLDITDRTSTYSANSKRMDVSLVHEHVAVREEGDVTVRSEGSFTGRVYFYRRRRQLSPFHNHTGKVTLGLELLRLAPQGTFVTILTTPSRIMSVGMTQGEAGKFLESRGLRQKRTGLTGDDDVVAEQEPELTMEIRPGDEVETFGVRADKISVWELDDVNAPRTAHYVRKMTGLDHKPVGTMKVFFAHPEMPMITFFGNVKEASVLMPENPFGEESPRGQVAVTNMSRPNRGTIGIRLERSAEFGPTGEERYGSNVFGNILSDLSHMLKDVHDGDIIYLRERKEGEEIKTAAAPAPKPAFDLDEIAEIARQAEFAQHAPPPGPFQGGSAESSRKKTGAEKGTAKKETAKKGGRPRAKRPKPE
ncbi:MAG: methanogenesis marker 3 protein [Methanomassiliicoccus sp.]|nr:methanogenesis marker 3 protein [Methanomassiliicoccus sp.]